MKVFRWFVLVPACVAVLYVFFVVTVSAHFLIEQHLCPAEAFDRGICNHRGMRFALKAMVHVSMAMTVLVVGIVAVRIAPSHKVPVLWATLTVLMSVLAYFGHAGNAASLFVAALVGAVVAAGAITRFLSRRAHAA
jgi:hypothetical protein